MCRRHKTEGRAGPYSLLLTLCVPCIAFGLLTGVSHSIKQENGFWLWSPSCGPQKRLQKAGRFCGAFCFVLFCSALRRFVFRERFCFDILLFCNTCKEIYSPEKTNASERNIKGLKGYRRCLLSQGNANVGTSLSSLFIKHRRGICSQPRPSVMEGDMPWARMSCSWRFCCGLSRPLWSSRL